MVKNGQKWPEMGFFHLQSFANARHNWRACCYKNIFLAPTFLEAGGGPIRYFSFAKMEPNGQKWPQMARNGLIWPEIFCKCSTQLSSMFLKKKLGAGVGAGSGQYGLFLQKWTQNGQKWPEMARNGLFWSAIFCKCSTQLASMFLEKYFFGPALFGGGGRANKVFFFAKMEPKC